MATQKRRVIYFSDEEWALLSAHARDQGTTISAVIRDMWEVAAKAGPADPIRQERVIAMAAAQLGHDPYREFHPAPKLGRK